MPDPRAVKLADILVNYSVSVQPGDWVLISANVDAMPVTEEVIRAVAKAGGRPTINLRSGDLEAAWAQTADEEQLAWTSPADELIANQVDVRIVLLAPGNTRTLSGMDSARQRLYNNARNKFLQTIIERTARGEHRWVGANVPCQALAQEADMSLREYEDFVYGATFADQDDPIQRWLDLHAEQQRIIDWLAGKSEIAVRGPNVDLTLSVAGRTWINSDGKRNMPSGEIFTGPVEDSANGWVRYSYPAISHGREVSDIELRFADGKVVDAKAGKNEEYLISQLDTDAGSRYLGEFAIGTNYGIQRFTKSILFDEKIGGTFHMAVGTGYPETGSKNVSQIHWDMICDMRDDSEISVDGEVFYRNGKFLV
ncbi:MAG: aminopeptidase [Caldilineaceae bacterium]|nr:aminopeptidase [Caldilineaceae bacterium]